MAFIRLEDAQNVRKILAKNGYEAAGICSSGAQAVSMAQELDGGVILCGYRLSDMHYSELYQYLPEGYRMLLVASPARLQDGHPEDIVCVEMPIRIRVLLQSLEDLLMEMKRQKKAKKEAVREAGRRQGRSESEKQIIARAKEMLSERNQMSEEEAHRYLQKISMDSGNRMVETAEMVLALMQEKQQHSR